ncbi:hypothetical protein MRY87_06990 [bacterium]|nr:hypothetical protein [bacterium]
MTSPSTKEQTPFSNEPGTALALLAALSAPVLVAQQPAVEPFRDAVNVDELSPSLRQAVTECSAFFDEYSQEERTSLAALDKLSRAAQDFVRQTYLELSVIEREQFIGELVGWLDEQREQGESPTLLQFQAARTIIGAMVIGLEAAVAGDITLKEFDGPVEPNTAEADALLSAVVLRLHREAPIGTLAGSFEGAAAIGSFLRGDTVDEGYRGQAQEALVSQLKGNLDRMAVLRHQDPPRPSDILAHQSRVLTGCYSLLTAAEQDPRALEAFFSLLQHPFFHSSDDGLPAPLTTSRQLIGTAQRIIKVLGARDKNERAPHFSIFFDVLRNDKATDIAVDIALLGAEETVTDDPVFDAERGIRAQGAFSVFQKAHEELMRKCEEGAEHWKLHAQPAKRREEAAFRFLVACDADYRLEFQASALLLSRNNQLIVEKSTRELALEVLHRVVDSEHFLPQDLLDEAITHCGKVIFNSSENSDSLRSLLEKMEDRRRRR